MDCFVDYRLAAGENGIGVADQIARLSGIWAKICLMTGDIRPNIAEGAKARGLNVLRKPIQPIRLSALLNFEASENPNLKNANIRNIEQAEVFSTVDAAKAWFEENDPDGVTFNTT